VGAKLILNTNDDSKVEKEFNQLNTSKFNPSKKTEFEFVQEVLLSLDSILRFTSLELWNAKSLAERKATASETLEASLKADDIANTTELVAETIMKAKHKISNTNELQSNLELRMSNLEKTLAKQQQQQKNSKGGRSERRSSFTNLKTAPPANKSLNRNSRNSTHQLKEYQPNQTSTKNRSINEREPSNTAHPKQKTKPSKSSTRSNLLLNTNQNEKKLTDFSKNPAHNKKRKALQRHREQSSDSDSTQSTTSEQTSIPQNNHLFQRRQKRLHPNQDVKRRGQSNASKRRKH
jgi:hypothetical protein